MVSLLSVLVGVAAVCVLAFIKWRLDRKVPQRQIFLLRSLSGGDFEEGPKILTKIMHRG